MAVTTHNRSVSRVDRWHSLRHWYDLLWELVARDMKVRYKRSALGFAWSLLLPISQLLVFTLLFHQMLARNVHNYPVYVFCGLLAWNWFSASLLSSVGAITENRDLVRRPGVPLAVLPAARMVTDMIHFLLALPVLVVFLLVTGGRLGLPLLALPAVIAVEGMFSLGLCYFVASINVTFRDTKHILSTLLLLLFYLTPIFWMIEMAPAKFARFLSMNPLYVIVRAYRMIFLEDRWPSVLSLAIVGISSALLLLAGHAFFVRTSRRFAEEI